MFFFDKKANDYMKKALFVRMSARQYKFLIVTWSIEFPWHVGSITFWTSNCISPLIIWELNFMAFLCRFLINDRYWRPSCRQENFFRTKTYGALEGYYDKLLEIIIKKFFNDVANIENSTFSNFLSKKIVVSSKKCIFLVSCRPDRRSKEIVTCLLELSDDVSSKSFLANQHPVLQRVDFWQKEL